MQVNHNPTNVLPIAVLGAAVGMIAALICISALWLVDLDINAGVVGGVAGAIAGAASALLMSPDWTK